MVPDQELNTSRRRFFKIGPSVSPFFPSYFGVQVGPVRRVFFCVPNSFERFPPFSFVIQCRALEICSDKFSRVQIALSYLVLRGLDTIEDDMTIPDHVKQPILRAFHIHTVTPGWTYMSFKRDRCFF